MLLTVNGTAHDVTPASDETLAETLRERLALRGTKISCARGECGACSVLLDGEVVYSCLTLTMACDGAGVRTIEGLSANGLHPVQEAFVANDAVQCGYCTPGQVIAAVALLEHDPDPDEATIRRAMSGNLCRCGTYPKIVAAIHSAAAAIRATNGR